MISCFRNFDAWKFHVADKANHVYPKLCWHVMNRKKSHSNLQKYLFLKFDINKSWFFVFEIRKHGYFILLTSCHFHCNKSRFFVVPGVCCWLARLHVRHHSKQGSHARYFVRNESLGKIRRLFNLSATCNPLCCPLPMSTLIFQIWGWP